MGMFDRVKKLTKGRERQISQAADKAGDLINKRTGGKYADKIDQAGDKLDDALRTSAAPDPAAPATEPPPAPTPAADPPPRPAG